MTNHLTRRFYKAIFISVPLIGSLALMGCDITPEEPVLNGAVEAPGGAAGGMGAGGMGDMGAGGMGDMAGGDMAAGGMGDMAGGDMAGGMGDMAGGDMAGGMGMAE